MRLEFDPEVERPTQPVTVRLPRRLLQELRVLAKDRDVPSQSLMKVLLAEKVTELRRCAAETSTIEPCKAMQNDRTTG